MAHRKVYMSDVHFLENFLPPNTFTTKKAVPNIFNGVPTTSSSGEAMDEWLCDRLNNSDRFTDDRQLATTIRRCIIAHKEACKVHSNHRDINAGRILHCPTSGSAWTGILNHCELSDGFTDGQTDEGNRQFNRTGTWQFASVHALNNYSRIVSIADELESFFHVMLFFAICFLPHNATGVVSELLYHYFDDYTNGKPGQTVGCTKFMAIQQGVIDITRYTGTKVGENGKVIDPYLTFLWPGRHSTNEPAQVSSHPIELLIRELLRGFKALYAQDIGEISATRVVGAEPTDQPDAVSGAATLALLGLGGIETTDPTPISLHTKTQLTNAEIREQRELAQRLETHDAMAQLLLTYVKQLKWPAKDKGLDKKPKNEDSHPKNSIPPALTNIGSKRVMEDGAEPGSKRVRPE